eukprot:1247312-Prymnesium_polylepis.1
MVVGGMPPGTKWKMLAGKEKAQAAYRKRMNGLVDDALAGVQTAAADLLATWGTVVRPAFQWTTRRERMHTKGQTVLHAWRAVVRRRSEWGHTTRLWNEA